MFQALATVLATATREQFVYRRANDGGFRPRAARLRGRGHRSGGATRCATSRTCRRGKRDRRRGRTGPIRMWCGRSHDRGITAPWSHQVDAADLAHDGRHVVLSTGTASGKSLAYQLPILTALATDPRARALYLSPTKALGHDQLRTAQALTDAVGTLGDVAPSAYDGDSPSEVRRFARERSRWIFSNPDMIHLSLLRNHARWAVFLRNLRYIVVDECHYYRGVFGSNVAMVLRRLLRLCTRYSGGADGHLRQCDDGLTGGHRVRVDRADGARGDRGRLTAGCAHRRAVGARAAHRPGRRKRRAGAAFRRRRGGTGDGRPDRRRRPHTDVRPVPARRRAHRVGCPCTAGGRRARVGGPGGVLSCRLPRRGSARAGTRTGRGRSARPGQHQRARARCRHRGSGRGGAGRLPRHRDVVLAAGRTVRQTRAGRADPADRARRSAGHLSGPPSGSVVGQADRAGGHRSRQSRMCSARNCSARQRSCR